MFLLSKQADAAVRWAAGVALVRTSANESAARATRNLLVETRTAAAAEPGFTSFLSMALLQLDALLLSLHNRTAAAARAMEAVEAQSALGGPSYGWPLIYPAEETAAELHLEAGDASAALAVLQHLDN